MKYRSALILILLIIVADQALKIFVKTHFCSGDDLKIIGNWFHLHFIENEGMAYGLKISESAFGKIILSSFRLVAVVFGFFLLKRLVDKGYGRGLILCGSLILAGALGNLIDSLFYGMIFTDSPYTCFSGNFDTLDTMLRHQNRDGVAHLTAWGTGYGHFLQGKVVDMFYFPIIETRFPEKLPFIGGKHFVFFEPVFNLADAAISVGVIALLLFQQRMLRKVPPANVVAPQV